MDPQACWREIIRLMEELRKAESAQTREMLIWHLQGLTDWLDRGGFVPEPKGKMEAGQWIVG
jgi:hypothetical protein